MRTIERKAVSILLALTMILTFIPTVGITAYGAVDEPQDTIYDINNDTESLSGNPQDNPQDDPQGEDLDGDDPQDEDLDGDNPQDEPQDDPQDEPAAPPMMRMLLGSPASAPAEQAEAPTFTPAAGTYTEAQSVTIDCETENVSIYYTTDDTEPTAESNWYTEALTLTESVTIKAIAIAAGAPASEIATAAYVLNLPTPVTIGNGGYPYGSNMSSSQVTLKVITASGVAESYQWQKAAESRTEPAASSFSAISGATGASITFAPEDGAWYRVVLNDSVASKAVQLIRPNTTADKYGRKWTNPYSGNPWYISNGTMAYTMAGSAFDVTGYFHNSIGNFMLQTSFGGGGWKMTSSTEVNGGGRSSKNGNAPSLDDVLFAFSDEEDYALYIKADLAEGQRAFSFGCDTQLGNSDTSGRYSDAAALIAKQNDDKSLNFVAMIGAASEDAAVETDPAFVIKPLAGAPSFWLGGYSSRTDFTFNRAGTTGPVYADYLGSATGTVKCEGLDSGMTMSWMNLPSGGEVNFLFSVGDVAATGAVNAGIDYHTERINGLENNTDYIITILNEDGSDGEAYQIRSSARGEASLTGHSNDTPSKDYDFTGKTIRIEKMNSQDAPREVAVATRPDAEELATITGTADRPINIRDNEVSVGANTIAINLNPSDRQKMGQEYCLVDEDGNEVTYTSSPAKGANGWTMPGRDGRIVFSGLEPNTNYTIKARVPATATAPASVPVTADIMTATTAVITVPRSNEATAPSDGLPHSFPIEVTGGNNPQVTYSTSLVNEYSDEVPSFTAGGSYTVYYRITQDDSDSVYGSYTVKIDPKLTFNANGGSVELSGIGGNVTEAGLGAVTVAYGESPDSLTAVAEKAAAPSFFAGWYSDASLRNLFWFEEDFANAPQILSDMTLYARWAQSYSTVNAEVPSDVTKLRLEKGGVPVPSGRWVDVSGGAFTIENVPDDEYNLVIKRNNGGREQTVTARVRVENNTITFIDGDLLFPNHNIDSKVTIGNGAPSVVVSGLERETLATDEGGDAVHWDFSGGERNPYAVLELKFSSSEDITAITQEDADNHLTRDEQAVHTAQTAIASEAGVEATVEFFDISVIRTDYEEGQLPEVFNISELQQAIEIAIPYTAEEGKAVSAVYRYHNGQVQEFERLSTRPASSNDYEDGTFFVGSGVVYVYTNQFSTYAIGTTEAQSRSRNTQKYTNVVKETANGSYTITPKNPTHMQVVTITPNPDEGFAVAKVIVKDEKGNFVTVTENSNGTFSFRQPDGAVTIEIAFAEGDFAALMTEFADAASDMWYHEAVQWAVEEGIMNGLSSTKFGPNDNTTRAQVATMLYRLAGSPAANKENSFVDVNSDMWYTDAINWAAEVGVILGWQRYSDGAEVFAPEDKVTREQLAAMIYRFAQLGGQGFEGLLSFNLDFSDADSVSAWADEAMHWTTANGIVEGIGNNTLDPQGKATRAQVATMMMRFCTDDK